MTKNYYKNQNYISYLLSGTRSLSFLILIFHPHWNIKNYDQSRPIDWLLELRKSEARIIRRRRKKITFEEIFRW